MTEKTNKNFDAHTRTLAARNARERMEGVFGKSIMTDAESAIRGMIEAIYLVGQTKPDAIPGSSFDAISTRIMPGFTIQVRVTAIPEES